MALRLPVHDAVDRFHRVSRIPGKGEKMCDILLAMPDATKRGTVVFGKNSDRPAGECQVLCHSAGGPREAGGDVRCSYVTVPESRDTLATVGCRPYWCWGYETGMNEAGVVGGNVAVFTRSLGDSAHGEKPGLTGMELLRFGLERGRHAEEAVGTIVGLLEKYGQWGSAVRGKDHGEGSYENAFLVADRREAWILETSGRRWVAERITEGVRSISNELSIRRKWTKGSADIERFALDRGWRRPDEGPLDFALAYSDHEHYSRQVSHIRKMRTHHLLDRWRGKIDAPTMMGMLRDHYDDTFLQGPQFHPFLPDFLTICMHESPAGFTWGNTATSMIVELDPRDPHPPPFWAAYLPPCTSIYMAFPFSPSLPGTVPFAGTAGLGIWPAADAPEDGFSDASLWWRLHRMLEAIRRDPFRRHKEVRELFDPIEREFRVQVEGLLRESRESLPEKLGALVSGEVAEVLAALDTLEARWGFA